MWQRGTRAFIFLFFFLRTFRNNNREKNWFLCCLCAACCTEFWIFALSLVIFILLTTYLLSNLISIPCFLFFFTISGFVIPCFCQIILNSFVFFLLWRYEKDSTGCCEDLCLCLLCVLPSRLPKEYFQLHDREGRLQTDADLTEDEMW